MHLAALHQVQWWRDIKGDQGRKERGNNQRGAFKQTLQSMLACVSVSSPVAGYSFPASRLAMSVLMDLLR